MNNPSGESDVLTIDSSGTSKEVQQLALVVVNKVMAADTGAA